MSARETGDALQPSAQAQAREPASSPVRAYGGKPDQRLNVRTRVAGMLSITLIYAVCFAAIKAGLDLAPPLGFAALRVLIAGVALLALAAVRHEPLVPPRRIWWPLLALALFSSTLGYSAMFLSPGRTGAGIASVLGNAQPLFAMALAALFLNERLTRGAGIALVLGVAGVTLIAYPALTGSGAFGLPGALLALSVSAGSAGGSVIVKRMGSLPSLLAITGWALALGGMPLLGASIVAERDERIVWNATFIGLLLFLALIGAAVVNALWFWLIQREDVGRLTMFFFLTPVFGLAIAALWFNEPVGRYEIAGLTLIAAGILGATRG